MQASGPRNVSILPRIVQTRLPGVQGVPGKGAGLRWDSCCFIDHLVEVGGGTSSKDSGRSLFGRGRVCFQMWPVFIWRRGLCAGEVRGRPGCAYLLTDILGPGTPQLIVFLFLLLSPFGSGGVWGVLEAPAGHGQWMKGGHLHGPLFQPFLTQKLLSHEGIALTSLFFF